MAVKPLSPAEIIAKRVAAIPESVITEINDYLGTMYKPGSSVSITFGQLDKWLTAERITNGQQAMRETIIDLFRESWHITERVANMTEDFEPFYIFAAKG